MQTDYRFSTYALRLAAIVVNLALYSWILCFWIMGFLLFTGTPELREGIAVVGTPFWLTPLGIGSCLLALAGIGGIISQRARGRIVAILVNLALSGTGIFPLVLYWPVRELGEPIPFPFFANICAILGLAAAGSFLLLNRAVSDTLFSRNAAA